MYIRASHTYVVKANKVVKRYLNCNAISLLNFTVDELIVGDSLFLYE